MKDADISDLMKKAKQSLNAAKSLLESGYPDFSAKSFLLCNVLCCRSYIANQELVFFQTQSGYFGFLKF